MTKKRSNVPRRMRQNVASGIQVKDLAPHRIGLPNDPPTIIDGIRLSKSIQVRFSNNDGATTNISPSLLAAGVPGGLTYWDRMRVESLKFWASSITVGGLVVTIPTDSGWSQPGMTWEDMGVAANQRPRIGLKLGLLERARYFSTADTTVLATVSTSEANVQITCQAVVELWKA